MLSLSDITRVNKGQGISEKERDIEIETETATETELETGSRGTDVNIFA